MVLAYQVGLGARSNSMTCQWQFFSVIVSSRLPCAPLSSIAQLKSEINFEKSGEQYREQMGVGGKFWDILKPHARHEGYGYLRNKWVAVDLSYWIVQNETAVRKRTNHVQNPHIRLTFFRTINLFSKVMLSYPGSCSQSNSCFLVTDECSGLTFH